VGKEDVLAARIVLNTGTRALRLKVAGLGKIPYIHSGNWLDHHEVPRHIVFVGAGYIGLEMSQFYRRMGSLVTVVDSAKQILKREDEDVVFPLQRLLEAEGIQFRLDTRVKRVAPARGGVL
jgi:pyruvate/2-oxoglutarate dehydrogenase complex dihydrolipoamide dehydrogenase (E3) component